MAVERFPIFELDQLFFLRIGWVGCHVKWEEEDGPWVCFGLHLVGRVGATFVFSGIWEREKKRVADHVGEVKVEWDLLTSSRFVDLILNFLAWDVRSRPGKIILARLRKKGSTRCYPILISWPSHDRDRYYGERFGLDSDMTCMTVDFIPYWCRTYVHLLGKKIVQPLLHV